MSVMPKCEKCGRYFILSDGGPCKCEVKLRLAIRDLYRGDGGPLNDYNQGWNDGTDAAAEIFSAEIDALRAEVAAIKAAQPDGWVSKWQPIETAPMDEMFLWGYWKNGRFSIGLSYRTVSKTNVDAYGGGDVSRFATHWLALPAAPMEAK